MASRSTHKTAAPLKSENGEKAKPCVNCGEKIPGEANFCNKCGSYQNWRRFLPVIAVLFSTLALTINLLVTALPSIRSWFNLDYSILVVSQKGQSVNAVPLQIINSGTKFAIVSNFEFRLSAIAPSGVENCDAGAPTYRAETSDCLLFFQRIPLVMSEAVPDVTKSGIIEPDAPVTLVLAFQEECQAVPAASDVANYPGMAPCVFWRLNQFAEQITVGGRIGEIFGGAGLTLPEAGVKAGLRLDCALVFSETRYGSDKAILSTVDLSNPTAPASTACNYVKNFAWH